MVFVVCRERENGDAGNDTSKIEEDKGKRKGKYGRGYEGEGESEGWSEGGRGIHPLKKVKIRAVKVVILLNLPP